MTGQHEGTSLQWQALARKREFIEELAGGGPRELMTAGQVVVARTGAPLYMLSAPARCPASAFVPSTDVTDDAVMAGIRAYIAAAHTEYADYAAERDAARERRDR